MINSMSHKCSKCQKQIDAYLPNVCVVCREMFCGKCSKQCYNCKQYYCKRCQRNYKFSKNICITCNNKPNKCCIL